MADTSYLDRTLTAFYDHRADAEKAMVRVTDLGVPDVRMTGGEDFAGREDAGRDRSIWESISDFFFPPEDGETYAEGLRRGGFLVTARNVSPELHDQVLDILDDDGSIDLDERADNWRSEGWTGTSASALGRRDLDDATDDVGGHAPAADASAPPLATVPIPGAGGALGMPGSNAAAADPTSPGAQDALRAGRRDTSHGRTRARSYTLDSTDDDRAAERRRIAESIDH